MSIKKIIITESMAERLVIEEIMSKTEMSSFLDSKDFKDAVVKTLKNNQDYEREFEKKVRKIVADATKNVFRGMWERSPFWSSLITNQ